MRVSRENVEDIVDTSLAVIVLGALAILAALAWLLLVRALWRALFEGCCP